MISYRYWRQRLRLEAVNPFRLIVVFGVTVVLLASLGCSSPSELTVAESDPAQSLPTSVDSAPDDPVTGVASSAPVVTTGETAVNASTSVAGSQTSAESGPATTLPSVETSDAASSVADMGSEHQRIDHVWIDFVALQSGRSWTEITAGGEATFLRFGLPGTSRLAEVKTGVLGATELDRVFSLLHETSFFDTGSVNPTDEGQIYEGDILVVSAELQGRENSATFRPPDHVPAMIEAMVAEVDGMLSNLAPESGSVYYVTSDVVSPARLDWLKENNTTIAEIDNAALADNYPSLAMSKVSPGRMVALGADERSAIARGISNETSIFLSTSDGPFQFEIFALES